jgi:hypothetical protein
MPDIQAMLKGSMQGQQGLAGMIPSGQNVGGAPPGDLDPATPAFAAADSALSRLCSVLRQFRDDVNSNQVVKLAYEVKKIQLSRRKEIAQKQADSMESGGNAVAAAGNSTAMGIPRGY